jgi:hypothetical protein
MTVSSRDANLRTVAAPMPRDPPLISTTLFISHPSFAFFLLFYHICTAVVNPYFSQASLKSAFFGTRAARRV